MSAAFRLPPGWGVARLRSRGGAAARTVREARSYDHLGTALTWRPGPEGGRTAAFACDIEHRDRFRYPVRVPGSKGVPIAIEAWIATEVLAKLAGEPVLAFLRAHGPVAIAPGRPITLDLARFGACGTARLFLTASRDGARSAGFGILSGTIDR